MTFIDINVFFLFLSRLNECRHINDIFKIYIIKLNHIYNLKKK